VFLSQERRSPRNSRSQNAPKASISKSVERAARLLLEFKTRDEVGVSELAAALREYKSVVHRTARTLHQHGFLEQDSVTKKFRLGVGLLELGSLVSRRLEVGQAVRPLLEGLVVKTQETAVLSVLRGADCICVDKVESPQRLRIAYEVGNRNPAYAGASPRAILAFMPDEEAQRILRSCKFVPRTSRTPRSLTEALKKLKEVRQRGYALSYGELSEGLRSIAVPVFDHTGSAVAAIALVGPASRMSKDRIDALVPVMRRLSEAASGRLGFSRSLLVGGRVRAGDVASP